MGRELTAIAVTVFLILLATSQVRGNVISEAKLALDRWYDAYGIERPWDELSDMPEGRRRHRGALAHVVHRIRGGDIPEAALANLYRDLEGLLALEPGHVLDRTPAFSDYQEFFEIDVFRLWKHLIVAAAVPVRWESAFKEAYYSHALGTGVPFQIRLPPRARDRRTYPMVVVLKGGPRVDPSHRFPFIRIKPSVAGIWGYRAISGYDVMQAIAFTQRHYPVDPDRVYLVGSSAGASGAMHVASSYPDAFAAVVAFVAAGNDYPVSNFRNLPVAVHHGTEDWTSSICDARVQVDKMQRSGCPAILREYEGAGHSVPRPHEPIVSWLLDQTRNRSPSSIAHQCETPALGRSYWIRIQELQDPHQRAFVAASVDTANGPGTVTVHPRNIRTFTLDLDLAPTGGTRLETVDIGGSRLATAGATGRLRCSFLEDRWRVAPDEAPADPPNRPYHAGAAANLYQGEPLLIVYGTGGGQSGRADQLRTAARKLAACGGPVAGSMRHRFPVVSDTALTPEQEANCNLILIGTPLENRITQAILPELPIAIRNDTLVAADRPHLPLRNQVLSFLHPHPEHPGRLVYLIAPFTDKEGLARFCATPERFFAGSDGFDRVSQADLVVKNLDFQIGRQMQFGKGWDWIVLPGSDTPIPARFGDRANLAVTYMEVMLRRSGADFALWWGPSDKGMWGTDFNYLERHNPEFYTLADFRTQHHLAETMTGGVTGAELKEIWVRWGQDKELLSVPEIQIDALADESQYRIHIPMDLYIKLGQRKKALTDPRPGPTISSEDVMVEIFQ